MSSLCFGANRVPSHPRSSPNFTSFGSLACGCGSIALFWSSILPFISLKKITEMGIVTKLFSANWVESPFTHFNPVCCDFAISSFLTYLVLLSCLTCVLFISLNSHVYLTLSLWWHSKNKTHPKQTNKFQAPYFRMYFSSLSFGYVIHPVETPKTPIASGCLDD